MTTAPFLRFAGLPFSTGTQRGVEKARRGKVFRAGEKIVQ